MFCCEMFLFYFIANVYIIIIIKVINEFCCCTMYMCVIAYIYIMFYFLYTSNIYIYDIKNKEIKCLYQITIKIVIIIGKRSKIK